MQNTDKGSNRADRKIFPSSGRSVEEDQSQPMQFPWGGWRVGAGSETLAIEGTATWTCQSWAKQQENPGKSQEIWDLKLIQVAVRLRLEPSEKIINKAGIQRLSDDAQLCFGHIQTQTKSAARQSCSPCALPLNRERHFHRTPGIADVGQIHSCSGIKFNTTVAKNYGWSHGGVESKDCEWDTAPVGPSL